MRQIILLDGKTDQKKRSYNTNEAIIFRFRSKGGKQIKTLKKFSALMLALVLTLTGIPALSSATGSATGVGVTEAEAATATVLAPTINSATVMSKNSAGPTSYYKYATCVRIKFSPNSKTIKNTSGFQTKIVYKTTDGKSHTYTADIGYVFADNASLFSNVKFKSMTYVAVRAYKRSGSTKTYSTWAIKYL